jgi:hypothetical protein
MKRLLLMFGLTAATLLAMSATMASAAGLNLRWNDCLGDAGAQNRTFACNTNLGGANVHALVGSFVIDAELAEVNGNELVLDLVAMSPTLPEWWMFFKAGFCRQTSLTIASHTLGTNCPDLFDGVASMNLFDYGVDFKGPATARIKAVNAVPGASIVTLSAGQEYAIARWIISNQKTVGAGSCAGCDIQVCLSFNNALITTNGDLNNTTVDTPTVAGSNQVTFQGTAVDCSIVPTRNTTWGAVKSLYR